MKQRQRPKMEVNLGYSRLPGKDSDDSGEDTELFVRKPPHQDVPTTEKTVEEGDTLQALSIRYHCSDNYKSFGYLDIATNKSPTLDEFLQLYSSLLESKNNYIAPSENLYKDLNKFKLKRLNNIHRENEIFAKRTIKVPARPFSMALASVHVSGSTSPNEKNGVIKKGVDAEILNHKLNDKFLSIPSSSASGSLSDAVEVNEVIFNSSVKPVTRSCDNIIENATNEANEEHISLLPGPPPPAETVVSRLSCSGADADISWIALIGCIVIVIFAIPLIYVFYIAEHPEQYHHSHYS